VLDVAAALSSVAAPGYIQITTELPYDPTGDPHAIKYNRTHMGLFYWEKTIVGNRLDDGMQVIARALRSLRSWSVRQLEPQQSDDWYYISDDPDDDDPELEPGWYVSLSVWSLHVSVKARSAVRACRCNMANAWLQYVDDPQAVCAKASAAKVFTVVAWALNGLSTAWIFFYYYASQYEVPYGCSLLTVLVSVRTRLLLPGRN
jgi:hypothetical protein